MAVKSHKPINTFLFENLSRKKGIIHFISTREGGTSKPPFNALNLSFNVSDDPKNVLQNRKVLTEALGIKMESITTAKQVHNNKVAVVARNMRGRGSSDHASALDGIDAMVTNVPDICLIIQVADCVPVLFYDPVKKVIAAAHAGWRGTVLKIAHNTINSMVKKYKSDPYNIYVGIGPSIGPCCYQVGHEVVHEVTSSLKNSKGLIKIKNDLSYFDLWEANKRQIIEAGVSASNIEVSGICTKDDHDTFFSSRAMNGMTGRFGAGIMLV